MRVSNYGEFSGAGTKARKVTHVRFEFLRASYLKNNCVTKYRFGSISAYVGKEKPKKEVSEEA